MHTSKCSKTLKVNSHEGSIALRVMREVIPITFNMVEEASKEAFEQGYILYSEKTGTKRWFSAALLEVMKGTKNVQGKIQKARFMEAISIEAAARNGKIQGLQSDMLKRALRLLREKRRLGAPIILAGHVHDETHTAFPSYMSTIYYDGKEITEAEAELILAEEIKLDDKKRKLVYKCEYVENLVKTVMKEAANYYLDTNIITMDSSSEIYPVLKK